MEIAKWLRLAWDRVAAFGSIAAGAVALILGWFGVSGQQFPAKQLPFLISGGVGGVFLLGLGALLWLSADLRDEWTELVRIEGVLTRIADSGGHDAELRLLRADGEPDTGDTRQQEANTHMAGRT